MPVDYSNLEVIRADIEDKLNAVRTAKRNLQTILQNISNIQKIQDPAFPDDDTKKIMPNDRGLGKKISQARTDSVYAQIVIDHAAL